MSFWEGVEYILFGDQKVLNGSLDMNGQIMMEKLIDNMMLNFGLQYLVVYGVLCLVLEFDGEIVEWVDLYIGLFYCGIEKFIEYKMYLQVVFYFDCLDYVVLMN